MTPDVGGTWSREPLFSLAVLGTTTALVVHMSALPSRRSQRRLSWPLMRHVVTMAWCVGILALPSEARASFLSEEMEDKLATFIAVFVLFLVPVVLIVLFWMVHVLPEKIAHKRHHPQFEAIRTLCLLSLVFGGLLWPLAWLWAYSKPVMYKMAYGTDKLSHDSGHVVQELEDDGVHAAALRDRIARLESRVAPADLATLRADVEALEARFSQQQVP